MRLFTGIAIPEHVLSTLAALVQHLRPTAAIKWSTPANFHVTTKFIGEWPEDRLQELKDVLASLPRGGAIPIAIGGIGWFPNPHRPRVLWAAVRAPDELKTLATRTDDALAGLGIERESKTYSPHLTLARVKEPIPLTGLRNAIAELESTDFGEFTANSFHLYQSKTNPSGSVYTQLAEFPLETE